ncbi:MAG: GyrI-like domain-containing protein [Planctomycetes bacterium]|nr:GyrI-like domain-containing protein [Planctomycetota bacterium]
MSKSRMSLLLLLVIVLMVAGTAAISAKSVGGKPAFAIRKVEEQVVLYTIYRGSYDKTGPAVGKLFALAGRKRITPRGPVSYVYLNSPKLVSSQHWLTEIRIPVGKEALKLSGTLGEMTDVKALPAFDVAVAVKPQGQADPGPIYERLFTWIYKAGYVHIEDPRESFLSNAMAGNYAQMKSEIMVPVSKFTKD